jgi:hypothetical protein
MTVAFASLFLGLVLGVQPVELVVGEGVARVELVLDGEVVGVAEGAPWTVELDFGSTLAPHELLAVARDASGEEVGRARQWINLPRPEAEASVVLLGVEDGVDGVAQVTWGTVVNDVPLGVAASFDGRPLPVDDPRRIALPDHDPESLHFLRVEIDFASALTAVAEVVFGGSYQGQASTELTAVPVLVQGGGSELPGAAAMEGWLTVGGRHATPVAVDSGPAEVVVVMDRAAQEELRDMLRSWSSGTLIPSSQQSSPWGQSSLRVPNSNQGGTRGSIRPEAPLRFVMTLGEDQVLRFLWPFSRLQGQERLRYALFPRSEDHPPSHGGVLWLLAAAQQPPFAIDEQRLADAVAVAGMTSSARGRRRAVVLVLSGDPRDASQFPARAVRAYLEDLRVPLFVWSVDEPTEGLRRAWGEVTRIDRESRMRRAVGDLAETLERQRILWIEGLHLPQDVALSERASGLELVD